MSDDLELAEAIQCLILLTTRVDTLSKLLVIAGLYHYQRKTPQSLADFERIKGLYSRARVEVGIVAFMLAQQI